MQVPVSRSFQEKFTYFLRKKDSIADNGSDIIKLIMFNC